MNPPNPTTDTKSGSTTSMQTTDESCETSGEVLSAGEMLAKRVTKRENVKDKGRRLLVSGRLRVVRVDGDLVIASCRGDSGHFYDLGFDPRKRQWRCTCEARTACSHLQALWSVVAVGTSPGMASRGEAGPGGARFGGAGHG